MAPQPDLFITAPSNPRGTLCFLIVLRLVVISCGAHCILFVRMYSGNGIFVIHNIDVGRSVEN